MTDEEAPDDDESSEFDGYYCECNTVATQEELDALRCACCGKPLL